MYNSIHEGFNISNVSTKFELKKSGCCGKKFSRSDEDRWLVSVGCVASNVFSNFGCENELNHH